MSNEELVATLVAAGRLATPAIIDAFRRVDRGAFVPSDMRDAAYEDRPIPLAKGATISQPSTVAFMLELLQPAIGDVVLDIGSGSGWTTALLAMCVGPTGSVTGTELNPALVATGRAHIAAIVNATIQQATTQPGIPGERFDKILVSAAVRTIPDALLEQLAPGGTMVLPVMDSLHRVVKQSADHIDTTVYPGFVFVPLR